MNKINLGCGEDYRDGWVNVDIDPDFEPEDEYRGEFIAHSLEETPWPLDSDKFELILVDNVLEHIHPRRRPDFIEECRRILSRDGKLKVRLPTHTGWDITHFSIPPWYWAHHPRHDDWEYIDISIDKTGPAKLLPNPVVLQILKYDLFWAASQVEITLK